MLPESERLTQAFERMVFLRRKLFHGLLALLALGGVARPAPAAESLSADHVRIRWLAPESFGAEATPVALHFDIDPGWHVYWKNPGDSGAAPKFQIHSNSAKLGPVAWPYPERLPVAHLTNLGYSREVAYPFTVEARGDRVKIQAKLEWLVCQEECTPGFGTLELERPVQGASSAWDDADQKKLRQFLDRVPASSDASPWRVEAAETVPEGLKLVLAIPELGAPAPQLFPLDGEFVAPASPTVKAQPGKFEVVLKTIPGKKPPSHTGFVLVDRGRSWEFPAVPLKSVPTATDAKAPQNLALLLAAALLGGLLLNLMPCVFPVLSIKALSLLRQNESSPEAALQKLREGLLYSAGVLTTFAALGGTFLALRTAGAAVGWGFQLQSPPVVLLLALLFWLMGMNFLGFFEFGDALMRRAGAHRSQSAFATGVLSVFVAAPCTGPFMGSALGAAATLPAMEAMAIFLSLGLGLSLPFFLLALWPRLLDFLPKPGAWMERLKQFLAFPLFATVVWLLWVLGRQTGSSGWVAGLGLLLVVSFALWLARSPRRAWRIFAGALALIATIAILGTLRPQASNVSDSAADRWTDYSAERLQDALVRKQSVFVDFTAAWCITCQVNKKAVLETRAAQTLFEDHQVLQLRADWTQSDPKITEALAAFGRNSVPLYVFYPADGSTPKILPQILTPSSIENLFPTSQNQKETP